MSILQIKVLLADDHILVLEGLKQVLKKEKEIEVINMVSNPQSLEEEIRKQTPDVLVLDVRFKSHNGIELTKKLLKKYPNLKVILVSGFNHLEYIQAASAAGCFAFLSKDKTNSELVCLIKKAAQGIKHFPNLVETGINETLTKRETTILELIAKDYSNSKISEELNISKRTVEYHISSIIDKLNVDTRVGAVVKGIQKGYLNF